MKLMLTSMSKGEYVFDSERQHGKIVLSDMQRHEKFNSGSWKMTIITETNNQATLSISPNEMLCLRNFLNLAIKD